MISHDRKVLRELGSVYGDLAADPANEERKNLWKRLNGLESVRPLVFIFEIPWHEMERREELTPRCEDPFLAGVETELRRLIYQWRHMPGDMVVAGVIPCAPVIHDTGIGLTEKSDLIRLDERTGAPSRRFSPQICGEEDIEKIRMPVVTHDKEETDKRFHLLCDVFDGILPVRKTGVRTTSEAPWDHLVRLTGVEPVLMDLALRPEYVHRAIRRMMDTALCRLRQFEELHLLGLNNDESYLGGGLNLTDELPREGFRPGHVRPADMWGRTMSQVFSSVSPEMHEEFALRYELEYLRQFGLTYYGCCEPLHRKIEILRQIPNLRKISMSPWVDVAEGAEAIGRDYVYSMKANPAFLAGDAWDPGRVRKDLAANLHKTRSCITEVVLKDISTVGYAPERLWEWARIAAEVAASA